MPVLYFWRRENFDRDIATMRAVDGITLQQNSRAFADITLGERIWAFTRGVDGVYRLCAQLRAGSLDDLGSTNGYGRFRVVSQPGSVIFYNPDAGPEVVSLIRSLGFHPSAEVLGRSFQGANAVRVVSEREDEALQHFAADLHVADAGLELPWAVHEARWWAALVARAERARREGRTFHSRVRASAYQVREALPDRVVIERLDAKEPAELTRGRAALAARRILARGGRAARSGPGAEFSRVAVAAAFADLHPAFSWDETGAWIEFVRSDRTTTELYRDYTREDVHDLLDPSTNFQAQRGDWGVAGIVRLRNRPGDFVFFVTFGKRQGQHVFDEGVSEEGVLTWQSQPSQKLSDPQIRALISHDELKGNILLFLRTNKRSPYTYLGRLRYLAHDADREAPVHFKWQLLSGPPPAEVARRIGLGITKESAAQRGTAGLTETAPPEAAPPRGVPTRMFRGGYRADYGDIERRNRLLGAAGEILVLSHEIERLIAGGREDLITQVRHVSSLDGDGFGYDILSFELDGTPRYVEVKTTRGAATEPFYISANEVAFSQTVGERYRLYRLYDFDDRAGGARFYSTRGLSLEYFDLEPSQYRARIRS